MSDDLIRRKVVLNILTEARVKDSILCSPAFVEMLTQRIKKIPTAFDKEKVKEQIQIFRSKFECTCCPKNIGKHIPVSCDECMDTFAKVNIVIVEKGGIE